MPTQWDLVAAREYVTYFAIDNEDFLESDDVVCYRFLNVAFRTLKNAFVGYIIPDNAVYLFAAHLNSIYNDTMVMDKRGVASFSVDGISFTFKDWSQKNLSDYITEEVIDLIEEENPDKPPFSKGVKWVVL